MLVGIIIGSVILFILLVYLLLLFWIYKKFFYSPYEGKNDEYRIEGILNLLDKDKLIAAIDKLKAVPYEDLSISSYDGVKLHAYFYENKNSNQYVMLFNGFRGKPRRDYCARALDLINDGKNVILCDQRGHGLSEGHTVTLGRREQHDVVSWVKYAQERFGKDARIAVGGTSLGATTVLLASDKLPPEIKIFADGCYSSQKDVIKHIVKRKKLNPTICWHLCYMAVLIFGHTRLIDDAAVNVAKSKCKILIVQCIKDTIAPMDQNKKLLECNKENVKVVYYDNIQHALAYFKEREKYKKMLYDFLDN